MATDTTYAAALQTATAFPDNSIDPRDKGFDWIMQYLKAAWWNARNYMPAVMSFNTNINRYAEIKQYGLGKQSISKYKHVQAGDDIEDNTALNNDDGVISAIPKFRGIALAKLLQKEYTVEASAVDPLAKSEEDAFFNEMKVKILMRQQAQMMQSPLANSPAIKAQPKEPQDMEQLQMEMDFGYKHVMAMEAEEGINLIQQQNDVQQKRRELFENLYDWGIGGYRLWIDNNGMVKYRAISGENLVTSYCTKSDFSDMQHAGEIIYVPVTDLAPYFDPAQLENIAKNVAGKYGNPNTFDMRVNRWWDKFCVAVLDMQFYSWNTTVWEQSVDNRDNMRFRKTDFKYSMYVNEEGVLRGGEATPKYINSVRKVIYKGKWIIGTEYMYDYGLQENQNRRLSSWWDTELDFIIGSPSFYKMQYTGITEQLIPVEDAYQLTWKRLQTFKNKLIPYLIELDLTALESVGLGKGGQSMTPQQIIDFAFKNFILLKRSTDLMQNNPNFKSMDIRPTGMLEAFAQLYTDLDRCYVMAQQISGLNELTDGSTPNSKTLVPVANAAVESTNNSLYMISATEKSICERLSNAIVQKIQIAVQLGKVQGYAKALGAETVKFYQINPDIRLYELGIFLREVPTQEERQLLLQELNIKDSQGLIEPSDKLIVQSCTNMKQATMYLAYAVKKRREAMHQQQMQLVQQQTQGNQQVAVASEQAKQQTLMLQAKLQIELENVKGQWMYITEQMKKGSDQQEANIQAQAKVISSQIAANAKNAANTLTA